MRLTARLERLGALQDLEFVVVSFCDVDECGGDCYVLSGGGARIEETRLRPPMLAKPLACQVSESW